MECRETASVRRPIIGRKGGLIGSDSVGPVFEELVLFVELGGHVDPHRAFEEARKVAHHARFAAAMFAFGEANEVEHQRGGEQ